MSNETMRYGRTICRAVANVAIAALCVGAAQAADAPNSDKAPAKKPAASSKSTAAPDSKSKTAAATTTASGKKKEVVTVPAACKPPTNFVEKLCVPPPAPQSAAQKFNTFEDIYSPPPKHE